MQDFAGLSASERQAKLDSMKTNIQYEMEDVRDGKTYTVAKLPNGSLWMTRNLDLAGGTTLTPATSNVASNYTLPTSSATGFDNNTTAFVYNGNDANSYYSFAATTAGTNPSSGDASYDICPKGWRLPSYNDYTDAANPSPDSLAGFLNNTLSGRYTQSQHEYNNEYGYYWLSTTSSNNYVRRIIASNGGVFSDSDYRYRGNSIRCMLNNTTVNSITTIDNIATMQEFANLTPTARENVLSSMVPNEQYTLEDSRDGKNYNVSKIGSTIWMTTNLDLAGGTTLTPADSNVAANYTLPASNPSGFIEGTTANVYNSGSTTCGANSPCYSYYNFRAAVANTIPGPAEEALYDICPKGWRLPNNDDFSDLIDTVDTINEAPWYGVYAGEYYTGPNAGVDYNSSFIDGGSYGNIWGGYDTNTNPIAPNTMAGAMYFGQYGPDVAQESYVSGLSIRCVSK
jgi:uncharacterized protein (TIGR02145 family)